MPIFLTCAIAVIGLIFSFGLTLVILNFLSKVSLALVPIGAVIGVCYVIYTNSDMTAGEIFRLIGTVGPASAVIVINCMTYVRAFEDLERM